MVSLSAVAKKLVSSGLSVHPLGQVTVRERAVPFDIQISRFQQHPIPPQTWSIASAELSPAVPANLGAHTQDQFPPGEFLDLTEDQKLSRPSFEKMDSGVTMTPVDVLHSDLRAVDTDYEVLLVPDITLGEPAGLAFLDLVAEAFLAVDDIHLVKSLWSAPNLDKIVVLSAQPVTVATTAAMTEQPVFSAPGEFTATLQAAQAMFGAVGQSAAVQIVEHWEVSA
jgi:hypothetical protein